MRRRPVFHGPIEGYVVNTLHGVMWRFDALHTMDDMIQEAWLVFDHVRREYPTVPGGAPFMALFKTAWENRMTDISRAVTVRRRGRVEDADVGVLADLRAGSSDNDGYLLVLIKQAPADVLQVINVFLNAPAELLDAAMAAWRANGRYRAGGNAQVSQWLGLPKGSKPLDVVRDYFGKEL